MSINAPDTGDVSSVALVLFMTVDWHSSMAAGKEKKLPLPIMEFLLPRPNRLYMGGLRLHPGLWTG